MSKTTHTPHHAARHIAVALACFALLLGGCGSSPPVRYFTLQTPVADTPATASIAPATAMAARSVLLVGLSLPDAVDRPQLVLRTGDNTLSVNEHARWAEPLKSAFAVALASEMRVALGGAPVLVRGGGIEDSAWKLSVDVQRFEAQPGRAAVLEAVWTLSGKPPGRPVTRASTLREAIRGDTLEAAVAAQSRTVASLAREIALLVGEQARSGQGR